MQTATPPPAGQPPQAGAAETAEFGNRLSRLEGISEQMDKRLESIEASQRQGFADVGARLANLESRVESGFRWMIGIQFTTLIALGSLILVKLG